jgi:hypothetical protein
MNIKPTQCMPDGVTRQTMLGQVDKLVKFLDTEFPKHVASKRWSKYEAELALGALIDAKKAIELTACESVAQLAVDAVFFELSKWGHFDRIFKEIGYLDVTNIKKVIVERIGSTVYAPSDLHKTVVVEEIEI